MPTDRDQFGRQGEMLAEKLLRSVGMRILERRYRVRAGEIDLIAFDCGTLVFVEVKTQSSDELLDPEDRVNRQKRLRMTRAARHYVAHKNLTDAPCRFDVVTVIFDAAGTAQSRHTREAFLPERW